MSGSIWVREYLVLPDSPAYHGCVREDGTAAYGHYDRFSCRANSDCICDDSSLLDTESATSSFRLETLHVATGDGSV